ncbi:hypothetical protein D3C78_1074500 [compost metagenome]
MFSITTILSSTKRPTATATPPSVIIFRLMPDISSRYKVTASESGIETAVISVARRLRRNSKITIVANNAPSNTSRIILFTEVTTISDVLNTTAASAFGMVLLICATVSCI